MSRYLLHFLSWIIASPHAALGAGDVTTATSPTSAKDVTVPPFAVGILVTPSTPSVNELGTVQFTVRLQSNTGALSQPLPNSQITWGPYMLGMSSVSSTGLATTKAVYENTHAAVAVNYGPFYNSGIVQVIDSAPDNYGNYAADGINDGWQVTHFGLNSSNAAPDKDPDQDGQTNLFEYTAGTLPMDASSMLRFRIEAVNGQSAHRRLIFTPNVTGRTYSIFKSSTLSPGLWLPVTGASQSTSGDERILTDANASAPNLFYRGSVTKP